jgi:hypothetical protein
LVKDAGILTADGELAPLYKSWGNKASRTPDEDIPTEADENA